MEKKEEAKTEERPTLQQILEKLGGPAQSQIEDWKTEFGEVLVSGFSDKEVYVWRPLTRGEYVGKQVQLNEGKLDNFEYEYSILETCLLWPRLSQKELERKGGTIPTLAEQIMQGSNFLNPAQASQIVYKL